MCVGICTVITEHLWEKERNKGHYTALVYADIFLLFSLAGCPGEAVTHDEALGKVSVDGVSHSFSKDLQPALRPTHPGHG